MRNITDLKHIVLALSNDVVGSKPRFSVVSYSEIQCFRLMRA